jgi:hypothetical protein
MPSLSDLYIGAGLSPKTAKGAGTLAGQATAGRFLVSRRRKLEKDLAQGHTSISSLGAGDLATLGLSSSSKYDPNRATGGQGVFKGFTGFFGNLGKDIGDFATGFFPGLYTLGKSAVHDVSHPGSHSELYEKIVKPTYEGYKATYGQGNVLENIYKHPLGPILDVATVASLGAGAAGKVGQVAARSGVEGGVANLAKITSREGRPSVALPGGEPIAREYTPRPLAKLGQIGLDRLGDRVGPLGDFQAKKAMQRESRMLDQEFKGQLAQDTTSVVRPLVEASKQLDPDESLAVHLALRGVNTPERMATYQANVRAALADPEKAQKAENLGVPRQIIERRAELSPRVQELVMHPTPAMTNFAQTWHSDVQRGLSQLPIEPEVHEARRGFYQRELAPVRKRDEMLGAEPDFGRGQIRPDTVPDVQATNFETHTPRGTLSKVIPGVRPGEEIVRPKKFGDRVATDAVTAQNIFVPRAQRYLADPSGETFMEGLFRADPKVFVEHAVRRERDLAERGFKANLIEHNAAKDPHGEVRKFKNKGEFDASGLRDTHVLVNPEFPVAWFRAETNFIKQAGQIINRLQEVGDEANEAVVQKMIDDLTDADAKAFLIAHWGAMKRPGVAVPNEFFNYQKQLAQVSDPFNNPAGRVWARFMHHWRNTVLAYMPRWGLNTAVGSFVTNMVKGVLNPMDYVKGNQLARQFVTEGGDVLTRPGAIQRRLGAPDLNFAEQRLQKLEPAGVSLQGEAIQEMLEGSMAGYQSALGINFPTRKLVASVQHIEDFFRRASFQHSLRREGSRWDQSQGANLDIEMPDVPTTGEALEGMGEMNDMKDVLTDHFEEVVNHNGNVPEMLQDSRLVQRALRDVNKFGYNYGALGPHERRYVRQFMPFYGWYKFISTLAARLPVEYPGRTAAMNAIAQVGTDMQNELGMMPEWIKGSIILGVNPDGSIRYLPTRGLNPFSSFFNPLSPGQTLTQASGMMNPAIQAGLGAIGYDTLTGDAVRISPQSGVNRDFAGVLVNEKGEQVSPRQVQALTRGLMGLARSVPGYRLGEKYMLEGGASVYPEHVPFGIQTRLMAPASDQAQTSGAEALGLSLLGVNPRGYDLAGFQRLSKKRAKYVRTKNRHSMMRTQRKFEAP